MNDEKIKEFTLNKKEFNEITEAHNKFNKTKFGKKIKLYIGIISAYSIISIFMFFIFVMLYALEYKNFDIYSAICAAVCIINSSLVLVSQIIYENMVMNFISTKK